MVKVYGTTTGTPEERRPQNVARQIAVVLAVCALALTVCVALIARADLRGVKRPVALYGLGSGEESSADASDFTAFETFDGQDEYMVENLKYDEPAYAVQFAGEDLYDPSTTSTYYKELFEAVGDSEEIADATKEVDVAVKEAQQEHGVLEAFADPGDGDTHNPFLAASEQVGR